jgi:hypothetical protein
MRYRKCPTDAAQSKTPGIYGNSTRENRETPPTPAGEDAAGGLENLEPDGQHARRRKLACDRNYWDVNLLCS